jgi:hypothetical protein
MCTIESASASIKNVTIPLIVHLVKTFVVSLPNADSAAPPPSDDPIPEFADGFCIKTTRTTKMLVQARANVSKVIESEHI